MQALFLPVFDQEIKVLASVIQKKDSTCLQTANFAILQSCPVV
jgi:hypothetical protein